MALTKQQQYDAAAAATHASRCVDYINGVLRNHPITRDISGSIHAARSEAHKAMLHARNLSE